MWNLLALFSVRASHLSPFFFSQMATYFEKSLLEDDADQAMITEMERVEQQMQLGGNPLAAQPG